MKKLSLLVAMILCVTIGGVYATWTYTKSTNVMDDTVHMSLNLTKATNDASYGTYEVDTSSLAMVIDPKEGTTHTTALYITGDIVITFTPGTYAPTEVKTSAIPTTFQFTLTNPNWEYEGQKIITLAHQDAETVKWSGPDENGVFTFVISAKELAKHIILTEFVLDTFAKYEAFNLALGQGQISITVSDGQAEQQA